MLPRIKQKIDKVRSLFARSDEREQLYYLLETADPKWDLAEKLAWLEKLMVWVRTSSPHRHGFDPDTGQLHNVRIRFLLHLLDRQPAWKIKVAETLRTLVQQTSAQTLFSDVGMAHHKGFLAELAGLALNRVLPRAPKAGELSEIFLRIFKSAEDGVWVSHIPPALLSNVLEMVRTGAPPKSLIFSGWNEDIQDSLLILGARIGAQGTVSEVTSRLKIRKFENYPFLRLNFELIRLVETTFEGNADPVSAQRCLREIENCRKEVARVYDAIEASGVSVGLVYVLESLSSSLRRVGLLVKLLLPSSDASPNLVIEFFASLVRERLEQNTMRHLVRSNLNLISKKVVERAGASGEHYIARNRREYFDMLTSGLGGGAMMVFTTLGKFFLSSLHLPLLFEGLFFSLNYSTSFIVLQLMGFTLATKQPSATASALAGKLRDLEEEGEVREFVNEVCRMTRTQFAALMGNLALVPVVAAALDLALFYGFNTHLISDEQAHYALHSLDPWNGLSVPMAALTGVYLWLSSLAAGWFENWVVFREIPEGIASQPRLIQVFGKKGARAIGDWVLRNATLLGGNISLGFFLGFTAVVGRFSGLPLDVRHVTLSAAQFSFAVCALASAHFHYEILILPFIGVLLIGLINFGVGYSLSFAVAARARSVPGPVLRRLFRAVRVRFRNRPRDFFYPPNRREKKKEATV